MELFLEQVYPEITMIIVRWYNNALLRYMWIEVSDLRKCISDIMVTTQAFYKIPGAEIIYYILGQPGTQSHRSHLHQGNTNNTTSSLSLMHLNGPQGSNNHANCSEKYDHQYGNVVYFLFYLYTNAKNLIFPGMKANFN